MGQGTLDALGSRIAEAELHLRAAERRIKLLEGDVEILQSSLKVRDSGLLAVQEQLHDANRALKKLRTAVQAAEANLAPIGLLAATLESKFRAARPGDPAGADFAELAGAVSLVLELLDRATKEMEV